MRPEVILALAALALSSTVLCADPVSDCNDRTNVEQQIRGCTQVIWRSIDDETLSVAYMNRGIAYAARREFSKALADLSSSLQADQENALAHYNRGNIFLDMRKYQQASTDLTRAIELDPDMALAYLNRGLANEKLGKRDASIADYRAAVKLDPDLLRASAGLKRLRASP